MKGIKKIIALCTLIAAAAAAMLGGMIFAEGEGSLPIMKFGISAGDTVIFGSGADATYGTGTYSAPSNMIVLDADQTSTGDKDGMFLASADDKMTLGIKSSLSALTDACAAYAKIFSADESAAIMKTTKKSSFEYKAQEMYEEISDAQIFLLSKDEAETYADLLKTDLEWWLRSVNDKSPTVCVGYINGEGFAAEQLSTVGGLPVTKYKMFRPGMNLDRGAVTVDAPFGSTALLLPTFYVGEGETLVSLSDKKSANAKYKLSLRDDGITDIKSTSATKDGNTYSFTVTTAQTRAAEKNEYISVIVTDGAATSANIICYGRFAKSGDSTDITLTMPDDVDMSKCKMYAFNEIYTVGKSGRISALTQVCTEHEFEYISPDADGHTAHCVICGYSEKEQHNFEISRADDNQHLLTCSRCGYSETRAHSFTVSQSDDNYHLLTCDDCDAAVTEEHGIKYTMDDFSKHTKECAKCGYKITENHILSYENVDDTVHKEKCVCGYFAEKDHSYGKYDTSTDYHERKCGICGHTEKAAHSPKFEYSDFEHREYCSICGYSMLRRSHTKVYTPDPTNNSKHIITCAEERCAYTATVFHYPVCTDDGNGATHTNSCGECGFSETLAHNMTYSGEDGGYMTAQCLVCKYAPGIKGAQGKTDGDFTDRTELVNIESTVCTSGNTWGDGAARNLFADGKFGGSGDPTDGQYVLGASFETKKPLRLLGIRLTNADDTYYYYSRIPETAVISGKMKGDSEYSKIIEVPLDGIISPENGATFTFLFENGMSFPMYDCYKIDFTNNSSDTQIGGLELLGTKGSKPQFSLDGVVVTENSVFVSPDEDFECVLASHDGHPKAQDVSVTLNSAAFDSYTYDETTGTLRIAAAAAQFGDYVISAHADSPTYSVTANLFRLKSNGAQSAKFGEDYTCTFTDSDGEQIWTPQDTRDLVVTIGGVPYSYGTNYNSEKATLTIPGVCITGDIVITARERASFCYEGESVISVKTADGTTRYFSDIYDAANYIDFMSDSAKVTLLQDINTDNAFYLRNGNFEFDFLGHTVSVNSNIQPFISSQCDSLTLKNGKITNAGTYPQITVHSGKLTLGENLVVENTSGESYAIGVSATGGDITADGVRFVGFGTSDDGNMKNCIDTSEGGTALTVKDGYFSGIAQFNSRLGKSQISGGSFDEIKLASNANYSIVDLLAPGYAYRDTAADARSAAQMFGKDENGSEKPLTAVIVVKSPLGEPKQENVQRDYGYTDETTLNADCTAANGYQWFVDGALAQGATEDTFTVSTGLGSGKHKIICIAASGRDFAPCKIVNFDVNCAHEGIADGVCPVCGGEYDVRVTDGESTVYYKNFYTAFGELKDGSVLTLNRDIKLEYGDVDNIFGNKFAFETKVTIDLGGKTLSGDSDFEFLSKNSFVLKDGVLKLPLDIDCDGARLENIQMTRTLMINTKKPIVIASGEFSYINSVLPLYKHLEPGKALRKTDGSAWITGKTQLAGNVKADDAPVYITAQPQSAHLEPGYETAPTLTVSAKQGAGYESEITYQWYLADDGTEKIIDGATESSFTVPLGTADGKSAKYFCRVSCEDFYADSDTAIISVGNALPSVTLTNWMGMIFLIAESNGHDCTVAVASYNGDELIDIKTIEMNADNSYIRANIYSALGLELYGYTHIKAFAFEDIKSLKPVCPHAEYHLYTIN